MDPLAMIFIPGGLTVGAFVFGAPVAALGFLTWRWRARRRMQRDACGRCGNGMSEGGERFLVTGISICEPCAHSLRRQLRFLLPIVTIGAGVFAVTSASAFVLSFIRGGPGIAWWLDSRWIPLLAPSAGVGLLTWALMTAGKRANRVAAARVD